jgi:tetratricopeptide (TPR) repeat protein
MFDRLFERFSAKFSSRFRLFREGKALYESFYRTQNFFLFQRTDEDRMIALGNARLKKAELNFKEAVRLSRDENEFEDAATGLFQLGMLYHLQGRYDEAMAAFYSAMETMNQLPQADLRVDQLLGDCHFQLGIIEMNRGDKEKAKEHLLESRSRDESLNNREGLKMIDKAIAYMDKR